MTATHLRTNDLTKDYASRVLHGIDMDIPAGQFVAIMGPSGSGKSTLLHLISGMDRPTGGTVHLGSDDLTAMTERQLADFRLRRLGFVFQQAHMMRTMCLLDNIVLPGFLAGDEPRGEIVERGRTLMERMGIAELASSDVTRVSGGQLQRAGICRALINQPEVVFGDEPTGALDSSTAMQILDLLGEIHSTGTTLVIVTHDPKVAARADRVLLLVDGRVADDVSLGSYEASAAASRLETVTRLLTRRGV